MNILYIYRLSDIITVHWSHKGSKHGGWDTMEPRGPALRRDLNGLSVLLVTRGKSVLSVLLFPSISSSSLVTWLVLSGTQGFFEPSGLWCQTGVSPLIPWQPGRVPTFQQTLLSGSLIYKVIHSWFLNIQCFSTNSNTITNSPPPMF